MCRAGGGEIQQSHVRHQEVTGRLDVTVVITSRTDGSKHSKSSSGCCGMLIQFPLLSSPTHRKEDRRDYKS
eukprot:764497-Hanusia_phi.AAC.8